MEDVLGELNPVFLMPFDSQMTIEQKAYRIDKTEVLNFDDLITEQSCGTGISF